MIPLPLYELHVTQIPHDLASMVYTTIATVEFVNLRTVAKDTWRDSLSSITSYKARNSSSPVNIIIVPSLVQSFSLAPATLRDPYFVGRGTLMCKLHNYITTCKCHCGFECLHTCTLSRLLLVDRRSLYYGLLYKRF